MTLPVLATVPSDTPSPEERDMARAASRGLARLSGRGAVQVDAVADGEPSQSFVLPAPAIRMLTDILLALGEGRAVVVMPQDAELTTHQAATMLNVSRPYLVRLLTEGKLPFHMVGTHRRVRLEHLMAYRAARDDRAQRALQSLAEEAQELGLDY